MPDWLIALLNNPLAITALGTALFVPLFNLIGQIISKRASGPPPKAHDVRDLPEHPLLVSTKVHLGEPELRQLAETAARVHDLDEETLPRIERNPRPDHREDRPRQ
jgi:hypothetical protein